MTLRLILETAPTPQVRAEFVLGEGRVVIGRGEDCDWKIDDPQMFVSRRHCTVMGQGGQYRVTDDSRGGLFLDGAPAPLGQGVTAVLVPGMRLRLGDFVIRAEEGAGAQQAAPAAQAPAARAGMFGDDFFTPRPEAPPPARPAGLPDPFDAPRASPQAPVNAPRPGGPAFFDDPFTLDPAPRVAPPQAQNSTPPPQPAQPAFGNPFDTPAPPRAVQPVAPAPAAPPPQAAAPSAPSADPFGDPFAAAPSVTPAAPVAGDFDFGDFGLPADLGTPKAPPPAPTPTPAPAPAPVPPAPPQPGAADPVPVKPRAAKSVPLVLDKPAPPADPGAAAAFLKGMGIEPPPGFKGTAEEMEALGRRYRAMVEGLVQLLRLRAREKGSARVAQTVIGAANVNPLKFLVTPEDMAAALVAPKGPGYLDPDAAIAGTLSDLMDHHQRSWSGLQASLRRMIDRFDPALFEADLEDVGMLKALVSGSRSARLWQLYAERYREMAKAAEDRFLGEVGADFREAYEGEPRRTDDGTA
jgi:type VI secretion system protein ImpI